MEQWPDRIIQLMKDKGKNTDVRLLTGSVTKIAPLRFTPDAYGEEVAARFATHVADGVSINEAVLAVQDVATGDIFVIARLVG